MKPVRVKYLGLLPITRRTYLVFQFIGLLFWIALMVVGLSVMLRTGVYIPHVPDMKVQDDLIYQLLLSLFWLGLLFVILESIETIVMLRKFARAAAEQGANLANRAAVEPPPSPPNSTVVQLTPNEPPNINIQP